jgi:thiamine monophosphate kinase
MTPKWIEGQIDDALLAMSLGAGFLYVRRRARRIFRQAAVGAIVAAGLGALGAAAAAAALYSSRSKRSAEPEAVPPPVEPPPPATSGWQPAGTGTPATASAGANSIGA